MGREQFSGEVEVRWLNEEPRKMQLLKDITFTDGAGRVWTALAHSIIDGASIPDFLWPIIGSPFVGYYRRPSVLHDVYCDNHLRDDEEVHAMFLEAMIADGVRESKAQKMYQAVATFGPRW